MVLVMLLAVLAAYILMDKYFGAWYKQSLSHQILQSTFLLKEEISILSDFVGLWRGPFLLSPWFGEYATSDSAITIQS